VIRTLIDTFSVYDDKQPERWGNHYDVLNRISTLHGKIELISQ
jgi:hypothetical protein